MQTTEALHWSLRHPFLQHGLLSRQKSSPVLQFYHSTSTPFGGRKRNISLSRLLTSLQHGFEPFLESQLV